MALTELKSNDELKAFLDRSPPVYSLICFSAHWCGPCNASKPELTSMASSFQQDPTLDIRFGIIYEDVLRDLLHSVYQVRAFPTYILFEGSKELGRVQGVNFNGIKQLIAQFGCKKPLGVGHTLGSGNGNVEEARMKRLKALEEEMKKATSVSNTQEVEPMDTTNTDDEKKKEDDELTEELRKEIESDPTKFLDAEAIEQLTSTMGFSTLRAQKGLLYGGGTLEGAVDWLCAHQDDADIDEPISIKLAQKAVSLTPEQKAAKIEELKAKMKAKRMEREEKEKVDNVEREKQRRFMGKEQAKLREDMQKDARKREADLRKKEKLEFKRERERIRAELAKDKAERATNSGKLQSKLGVDGYNPSVPKYDTEQNDDTEVKDDKASKQAFSPNPQKIDEYITKISSYRAGGDGGKCLKILSLYIGNILKDPKEAKFRRINLDNKAYKAKVKPFIGAKSLLFACGFEKSECEEALVLPPEKVDANFLKNVLDKLSTAMQKYG